MKKNKVIACFVLLVFSFLITTNAQTVLVSRNVSTIDSGSIYGAKFKILFPQNWKGKLVMYAHGYEFMGSPLQSSNPALAERMQPFLERGFAVACSDYRKQGFALPEGIEDVETLRKYFFDTYGKPDTVFMVGHSMGGGVTLGTIENYPQYYNGGLPLCPLSSQPYVQCRKEFDMLVTFNVLFPGIVPMLSEIMNPASGFKSLSFQEVFQKMDGMKKQLLKDSVLVKQFAKRFDLKPEDLPGSILFNENVLRDLALKAGGNPFDNTNTLYSGFPDDWEINQKVERLTALPGANKLLERYNRTGDISKPVVLMHTIYDQLIPPAFGVVNYDNMVHQKGKEQWLVVKYTKGQGHCQFTPGQTGIAFDILRNWAANGERPKPGSID